MLLIQDLVTTVILVIGVVNQLVEANTLYRIKRQSDNGNGEIIDNIFNIPITAIRQTSAAAQSFYPDSGSAIDTVFNIPVATLEAVGNLVKTRNSLAQRRPMDGSSADDIRKRRKERKERLHAQRRRQRLQQHKDPLGVNALTDLLVGNHGLLSGHGVWNGHHGLFGDHSSSNWGSQLINHFNGHGSSGSTVSSGSSGSSGSSESSGSSNGDNNIGVDNGAGDGDDDDHDPVGETPEESESAIISGGDTNGYEVTELIDENRSGSGWGGWFDFGNFFGGSSSGSRAQNKIAPRPDRRNYARYDDQDAPLENKIAPKYDRTNYRRSQLDRPLENKIAPKNERRNYQRDYRDPPLQDRVARRRGGSDRFVFEHRSL